MVLILPLVAQAAGGSWSQKASGPTISIGEQAQSGRPLRPSSPLPAQAQAIEISWRIALLTPAPGTLKIELCSHQQCLRLEQLSGRRTLPPGMSAHGPFTFRYTLIERGPVRPPLQVSSQQLTINYTFR
ncbi:Flagellar protein flhE [Enterobacter cancerogenus]|uniref:flagellar protein FlhE n=1 Tax=Enterobacter cancerogenus TaxID=69218 RepID=UPI00192539FA|nr:flagellar protein FlhE [Enterobacter cancerogenus]CAD5358434.1 Flagellar protein flhE [Enterobacter cancerogenus]